MKKIANLALMGVKHAVMALSAAIVVVGVVLAFIGAMIAIGGQIARDVAMGEHKEEVIMGDYDA